jgi:SAM-dependent methyltransferase
MRGKASHSPAWPRAGHTPVERYFGPIYHRLYSEYLLPGEQADAEAAFLLRALKPRPGACWLDTPCGYGRHLVRLRALRPDLRLAGLERQIGFLQAEAGLRGHAVNGDMRWLPFAGRSFDAVLNLFNSFGYYPARRGTARSERTDTDALAEWARVLKRGGRLVLDLSNRRTLLQACANTL